MAYTVLLGDEISSGDGAATATAALTTAVSRTISGNDDSFGPQFGSAFDFTLLFDHSVLTIVPTVLLITACPLYLYVRHRNPIQVDRDNLFWAKLGTAAVLFVVQLIQLILWTTSVKLSTDQEWAVAASTVSCFAALCTALMLNTEHRRSITPSSLLSIYFFITVFLDGIKARSYLLREGLDTVGAIQVVVTVIKFMLLILEEVPKTSAIRNARIRDFVGRESLIGFWTRFLFLWLNELFVVGFRGILTVNNLGNLDAEFSTEHLVTKFNRIWAAEDKAQKHALVRALMRQHGGALFLAAPARVGFAVCSLLQALIVYRGVQITEQEDATSADKSGLLLSTALVYAGILIFRSVYAHLNNRTVVLIRGTLLGRIYGKTLVLPAQKAKEGGALTHITADVDSLTSGIVDFHDLWISVFEIGVATFLLYHYVRYSCFLLFIPAGVSVWWSWYFGPLQGDANKVWNNKIEERVSKTTALLAQARSIKVNNLTSSVAQYIQTLRKIEIQYSKRYRWVQSFVSSMMTITESITPVIIVAGALWITKVRMPLEADRMFTVLAIVAISYTPMQTIVSVYPVLRGTVSTVDRIQEYLILDERRDGRTLLPSTLAVDTEKAALSESASKQPISFHDASMTLAQGEKAVVNEATLSVPRGELTIITGPTGSGKSIFLKSIIGEAHIQNGEICIEEGVIAYCDQKPWMYNDSIRSIITGRGEVDEAWYQSVLRYCCLLQDLRELPDGDQTLGGSNGYKLSGGQQHRVALARALFLRAPIMVLDDIFSALDKLTARQIFNNLFGRDGILRTLRTTVILATHSTQFVDAADLVLHFDKQGKVTTEPGLRKMDSIVADESTLDATQTTNETTSEPPPDQKREQENPELVEVAEALEDAHHRGDWNTWVFFYKQMPVWAVIPFLVVTVMNTICEKVTSIYMRIWIDHYPNSKSLFAGYVVIGFASTLTYVAMAVLFFQIIMPRYANRMHKMLVDTMLGANIVFLTSTDHAILINRICQDMTLVTQRFGVVAFQFPYSISLLLTDIGLVVSASYYTIILIIPIFAVFYAIQLVYLRTSRQMRLLDLEAKTPLYKQLIEIMSGVEHIRAFRWEDSCLEHSYRIIDESQRPFYYMSAIQRWLALVLDGNNLVLALVLMSFACYWNYTTSQTGIGLGFIGLLSLGSNFNFFMDTWTNVETSIGAIARLRSFIEETPQEQDHPEPERYLRDWPERGKIEFKNVFAEYRSRNGKQVVLRDVSCTIEAGKTAGFIGRTGSGKSSLFLVLLGGLEYRGSIKIDGKELRRIPLKILRSRITAIPQEGLILPGTIRQNLMPWLLNEANPKRANQCSMLAIAQVLEDTMLTEKIIAAGNLNAPMERFKMSAGELQMFSVARSMFLNLWYNGKIVLMDEASSNVDYESDERLQWVIGEAFHGLTICSIAHRTNTVKRAKVVYRMDNGVISVARGRDDTVGRNDPGAGVEESDIPEGYIAAPPPGY